MIGLIGVTAALISAPLAQAAPDPVVVTPAATAGWTTTSSGGAAVAFVTGPAATPAGTGSTQLSVGAAGEHDAQLVYGGVAGTPVEDLQLTYSTFVAANVDCQAAYVIAAVDHNGDSAADDSLFFEPCYQNASYGVPVQGPVATGVWQEWDTGIGGWWSLVAGTFGPPVQTLATYGGEHGDATVLGIRLVAGFGAGAWDGFSGNVDAVTINGTTFDFEAQPMLGDCAVTEDGAAKVVSLIADCTTDQTLPVPDGWTFDGAGFTVTAVDPANGHFVGAVIRNAGTTTHVRNVTVTASDLVDACDGGDDRLRGILLDGSAGSVTDSTVVGINQGTSGCQEGNAIEVRNAPFDTTGPDLAVTVSGNEIRDYQKTGIIANGSLAATVVDNVVEGSGPVDHIAQNGIQVGFGATATVQRNTVTANSFTPASFESCGLLFFQADGVRQSRNTLGGNERDLCNFGRGGGRAAPAQ